MKKVDFDRKTMDLEFKVKAIQLKTKDLMRDWQNKLEATSPALCKEDSSVMKEYPLNSENQSIKNLI